MKRRNLVAILLMMTMMIVGMGNGYIASAEAVYVKIVDVSKVIDVEPGKTNHIKLPVVATSEYITSPMLIVEPEGEVPFTVSDVRLSKENSPEAPIGISSIDKTYIEFDVVMKDSAKIGNYKANIEISFVSSKFNFDTNQNESITTKLPITFRVTKEKAPIQIVTSNVTYNEDAAAIGNVFDLSFDVKNEGEINALNTYVKIDYEDSGLIPKYAVESMKLGDLTEGQQTNVKLPIEVLATASEGLKKITAIFTYKNSEGVEGTVSRSFYITVKKMSTGSSDDAKITAVSSLVNEEVKPGTNYDLKMTINNIGKATAKNIKVTLEGGIGVESGILPNFTSGGISVKNLAKGDNTLVSIPLLISKSAAAGLKEVTVSVSYEDTQGTTRSAVTKSYLTVMETKVDEVTNEIEISGVTQSPNSPTVGETIAVSFTIKNKGSKAVSNLKAFGNELSSNGFEPLTAAAYERIGTIKAGESKNVTLNFRVGSGIAEGLNPLKIGYSYTDAADKVQTGETTVYVLDVKNDSNSKPKLIVTDFSTDSEELRAGSTFDFTFALKNTHMSKNAKNIKVTISQKDSVFSASQGSNSFYIDRIGAGETVENTMNLKVKADAATGAYEVEIAVEYEYDDMSKIDLEAGGVKDTNTIKLQAVENARPVIENVAVGAWDAPMVNQSTGMSFEFYNMGKSTLNNVYFTLEGDFVLETGEMYFLGPVQAGGYEIVEPMVIPQVSGPAGGTILIHFEDSNGDETIVRKEFSDIFINEEYIPDFSGGMDDVTTFNPVEVVKKDILPLWAFLLIQAGIVIIFIPVVRKIVITGYKRKLHKQEEESL